GEDRTRRERARDVVGVLERRARGVRRVGMVPEPRRAREGGVERTVGGRFAERTTAAEALRREGDDVGAPAADRGGVEPPARGDGAAAVLGDDVRGGAEVERERAADGGFEIEADAALAAVLVVEGPRAVRRAGVDGESAEEVRARRRFDLDDLRAEV